MKRRERRGNTERREGTEGARRRAEAAEAKVYRMAEFSEDYRENVNNFSRFVRAEENFDTVVRRLAVGEDEVTLFFVNGMTKDGEWKKTAGALLALDGIPSATWLLARMPEAEADVVCDPGVLARCLLAGETVMLSSRFGRCGVALDLRTYPAREVGEPEGDKVMQGARDGFVETLTTNTALIRRRIRDVRLTMAHHALGGASGTDVVVCYMEGVADPRAVKLVTDKVRALRPKSLTLGTQSLAETLVRGGWWNPFPKIRTTERPDTAAAQVVEGSILILCDTSPLAMILPTSIFDYLQQTDDYYFPPLTGTYLRLVRTFILLLSVVSTPLWYLALMHPDLLPETLGFLIPKSPGVMPILAQLLFAEVLIDGLKIASMNTPDMLSNSLSIVGALILGDFAVDVGWFCEDVVLYMAFVAIASFAQQNYELGYAFKFMRVMILALTAAFDFAGFIGGLALFFLIALLNRTPGGRHVYFSPLVPFNGRAMRHLLFRTKKDDFEEGAGR